jgi:UDP-N-acetylmuramate dehydrogenase
MIQIRENVSLKPYNTFGIDARCDFFVELNSIEDFLSLLKSETYQKNQKLILGGGSNILFTKDFKGIVIKNNFKGITIESENDQHVLVKVAAGEVWHDFVMWSISKNLAGIENLSLIPGCVGATPMQNIGAYGVEIKEVFHSLKSYDLHTGALQVFNKEDCAFGYRESVFKNKFKNKVLITSVIFILSKNSKLNTSYGAINAELQEMNISTPSIKDVSEAVIRIRQSKLPDPAVTGNAGSFFKNPEVSAEKHSSLKTTFENLVAYPLENGNYKLAAGWLIEQCGLKGYNINDAAVHTKQALVLINKGDAKGEDVLALSDFVIKKVFEKFGVKLEREVNII